MESKRAFSWLKWINEESIASSTQYTHLLIQQHRSGVIIWHQPKQCTRNRKSHKIITFAPCLIPKPRKLNDPCYGQFWFTPGWALYTIYNIYPSHSITHTFLFNAAMCSAKFSIWILFSELSCTYLVKHFFSGRDWHWNNEAFLLRREHLFTSLLRVFHPQLSTNTAYLDQQQSQQVATNLQKYIEVP